jgi:urease accessory protein
MAPRRAIPTSTERLDLQPLALLRLFHLVSPALPVGAYAYSQGLESAVQAGWVRDEATTLDWLSGIVGAGIGTLDLPILARMHGAWCREDDACVERWNAELIAARESAELRAEERHLGAALARVLIELEIPEARGWLARDTAFATLFSLAAVRGSVPPGAALAGYAWAWCENQVLAALKLVPLGQSAGQRVLHALTQQLPGVLARALSLPDASLGTGTFSQVLAATLHESQYSRLFRS